MVSTKLYTAEELAAMPTDEPWELWKGELRKVPGAGIDASAIAGWLLSLVVAWVRPRGLGVVTGADGTFILARDPDVVVVPDVAFIRQENLPGGVRPRGYAPFRPDFAIEVVSPSDRERDIEEKMAHYRNAGVPLVWWVRPKDRSVGVYLYGQLVATLREGDVLHGEDVLPGFVLPVADIFG
jgi:Uma2 family endonuclease